MELIEWDHLCSDSLPHFGRKIQGPKIFKTQIFYQNIFPLLLNIFPSPESPRLGIPRHGPHSPAVHCAALCALCMGPRTNGENILH